jgi:hypothetical protein
MRVFEGLVDSKTSFSLECRWRWNCLGVLAESLQRLSRVAWRGSMSCSVVVEEEEEEGH